VPANATIAKPRRTREAPSPYGPRRRPGRPTKLTYELADSIIALIRQGVYVEIAAQTRGVSKARLYEWAAKAEEWDQATEEELESLDDEMALFVWFRDAYKGAEGEAETALLLNCRQGKPGWQAYMTILERRFPARWRRREEIEARVTTTTDRVLDPETRRRELAEFGSAAALAIAAGPEAVQAPADA
jgi:hypothetical protein